MTSSIYIHIPFCKQSCFYCDFHFSTNQGLKSEMVEAICAEIVLRKDYLIHKDISSIYFGGGTPSLLSISELAKILDYIHKYFNIRKDAEITLEANPDDLKKDILRTYLELGINRLSIGIQSFDEKFLSYMNRSHTALEAKNCIENAKKVGFEALSIDLIYGIPHEDHSIWEKDLAQSLSFNVPHISAYCLTIEEKTVFGNWLKKGKLKQVEDSFATYQFELLLKKLYENNYEHYEISNFAKNKKYALHNTNYWKKNHYLGLGASAHSYDGQSRQYNISHNKKYIDAIKLGQIPCDIEMLSRQDHINEYLMLSLRTMWGCDLEVLKNDYGYVFSVEQSTYLQKYIRDGYIYQEKNCLFLTEKGKLWADQIAADFFII